MIQKFVNYIIRPRRNKYNPDVDLGPTTFLLEEKYCGRIDFEVINRSNKLLKCSLFHRMIDWKKKYPLVVYCHGNSGNRTESYGPVTCMLKQNIMLLTFDFSGCGLSEGEYISLGYYEQYDVDDVLNYALNKFEFIDNSKIGIWGRSMGAVSSILFCARHPEISILILDSPFCDLSALLKDYLNRYKIISKLMGKYIYKNMRSKILQMLGFDFEDLNPSKVISNCKASALFLHGLNDNIIPHEHSETLYEIYQGSKELIEFDSGHNEIRSSEVYEAITTFIKRKFCLLKYDNFKPTKKEASIGPKKVFEDHITLNNQSGSSNIYTETDEATCVKRNERKKNLVYISSPINKADGEKSEKLCTLQSDNLEYDIFDITNSVPDANYSNKQKENAKGINPNDNEEIEGIYVILNKLKNEINQKNILTETSTNTTIKRGQSLIKETYEENFSYDDLYDSTNLEKKEGLQPVINNVAETKFQLFREKKKTDM